MFLSLKLGENVSRVLHQEHEIPFVRTQSVLHLVDLMEGKNALIKPK